MLTIYMYTQSTMTKNKKIVYKLQRFTVYNTVRTNTQHFSKSEPSGYSKIIKRIYTFKSYLIGKNRSKSTLPPHSTTLDRRPNSPQ